MIYDVKPVGDANCIVIHSMQHNDNNSLMIDFGSPTGTKFTSTSKARKNLKKDLENEAINVNEFLLSHYHKDHYQGLFSLLPNGKVMNISILYYPRIPNISTNVNGTSGSATNLLVKTLYFISLLSYASITNIGTGVGIVSLMKNLNKKHFQPIPICEGDIVFDNLIDVIWPPMSLTQNSNPSIIDTLFHCCPLKIAECSLK